MVLQADATKCGRVECALFLYRSALCMDRSRQDRIRREQPRGQANFVKRYKSAGEETGKMCTTWENTTWLGDWRGGGSNDVIWRIDDTRGKISVVQCVGFRTDRCVLVPETVGRRSMSGCGDVHCSIVRGVFSGETASRTVWICVVLHGEDRRCDRNVARRARIYERPRKFHTFQY